ncbi:MAG: helix-turn-helix domain-containing protein [Flavobacteriales bacterium]|nr:helix-turn-helix domain-containing protein [Flavobacteriales bacterium]
MRNLVGDRIRELRKRKSLTQQELADRLEVDRQYIWKIENAKVNITMDYLEKVIRSLDYSYHEFFRFPEDQTERVNP